MRRRKLLQTAEPTVRKREEMEDQLDSYALHYFSGTGKAQGQATVYGAVAYGTLIRGWHLSYTENEDRSVGNVTKVPLMGGSTESGYHLLKRSTDPQPGQPDQGVS
ncbi:fa1c4b6c-4c1d-41c7-a071-853309eb3165 [Sclerotinia trifoliorum]|uniref:Fa1c4b6c-4c1d-41c7-a071-853309eb3165 n=1 Tax=Sclerotinia trifoliorum TaxID=28548 RepID=A0A8H2W2Y0_9HELO|nr:fa1c4b6c-4c1d-41c7-a071-853309eb3165 [Sclerotinia trifoliorum]